MLTRIRPFINGAVPDLDDLPLDEQIGSVRFVEGENKRYICVSNDLDVRTQWRVFDEDENIALPPSSTDLSGIIAKQNVTPQDFGASGKARKVTDAVYVNGDNTVTSATGFIGAEVGMTIFGPHTTTGSLNLPKGTITAINSATSVEVSIAPGINATGEWLVYGWDDADAIRAACAAAQAQGKNLVLPPGGYLVSKLPFDITNGRTIEIRGGGSFNTAIYPDPEFDLTTTDNTLIHREAPNTVNGVHLSGFTVDGAGLAIPGTTNFFVIYGGTEFRGRDLRVQYFRSFVSAIHILQGSLHECTALDMWYIGISVANQGWVGIYNTYAGNCGNYGLQISNVVGSTNIGPGVLVEGCRFDECGNEAVYVTASDNINFVGCHFFAGTGTHALGVDGTSKVRLSQCEVLPYDTGGNRSGLRVLSGGVVYASACRFASTSPGKDITNSGTVYDLGGNQYTPANLTGPAPVSLTASKVLAFSALPSASTCEGATMAVSDSSTATWGATITGGGANHVLAYSNGTNWTVAGK